MLAVSALLTACAVGPNYHKPEVPAEVRFEAAQGTLYGDASAVAWFWTEFNDPLLNHLVDDALRANHDLRIAEARFAEVRDRAR